jgi:two-component system cell cycle sensor histidine kinase/response regulator CckA
MRVAYLIREFDGSDTSSKGGPKSKVVLVVDDNDEFRLFIRRALDLSDFNVIEASDGEEALAVIREKPSLDLVVCDVILPGMKGPELMRKIRDQFPDTKVIFMSGYIAEDIVNQDVEKILASGGFFLQKPFPTRELLEVVHEMLDV